MTDRRLNPRPEPWWLLIDPLFVVSVAGIGAMGTVLVYSSTRGSGFDLIEPDRTYLDRQIIFLAAGAVLGTAAALVKPRLIRRLAPLAYGLMAASMLAVLAIGAEVHGARSWFSVGGYQLQPSELGKVVMIVTLALIFSRGRGSASPLRLGLALLSMAPPVVMIMLQPDPGTALVYGAVFVAVVVVSGVKMRWIALMALVALAGGLWVLQSDMLAGYQQARLTAFLLDPEQIEDEVIQREMKDFAYNARQAQIAIGNGGLTGQGLFEGTQTRSNLVPAQQTDFIFTVAGEEMGLRGAGLLLGLYSLLMYRIWRTARNASSVFGRLVCTGVLAMFLFQLFQSVGMTMGMMPVTGIPLPLVSYGGSSMFTSLIALGLAAGVHRRRYDVDEMRR